MNALLHPPIGMGRTRWLTHAALLAITLGGLYATHLWYAPNADASYILTIGCGYLSLALLAAQFAGIQLYRSKTGKFLHRRAAS